MTKLELRKDVGELKKGEYNAVDDGDCYIVIVEEKGGHRAYTIAKDHPDLKPTKPIEVNRDVGSNTSGL